MSKIPLLAHVKRFIRRLSSWIIPSYEYGPDVFLGQVTAVSTEHFQVDIKCERVWCRHYDLLIPEFVSEPCCYRVSSLCTGFVPERLAKLLEQSLVLSAHEVRSQKFGSELESCINLYLDRLGINFRHEDSAVRA